MSTVSWIYLILICAALISVGMYLFKRVVLFLFLLERRDYYQEIIYMICWGCSQTSVERPTVLLSSQQYIVAHTYVSTVQS